MLEKLHFTAGFNGATIMLGWYCCMMMFFCYELLYPKARELSVKC